MHTPSRLRPPFIVLLLAFALLMPGAFAVYYPTSSVLMIHSKTHRRLYSFPQGGRTLFPAYRLVALYGTPGTPALGSLGEQDMQASIAKVKTLAAQYQTLVPEHVLPTFEIISTVASNTPTEDGSYSYSIDVATLKQWTAAARFTGVYVVVDLQPGRVSFLSQAQQFADVLQEPNIGLALDHEWRLGPAEYPLERIGSVSMSEVNQTSSWLATLVDAHKLPQKLFLLHQFRLDMLPDRGQLDTWRSITANPLANTRFGRKNFYTKGTSLRTPEDTMMLSPAPWYISYQ